MSIAIKEKYVQQLAASLVQISGVDAAEGQPNTS